MHYERLRKTKHVRQLDQRENTEHRKRRSRFLPMILRALLPLGVLVSGWVGYSILSLEPEGAKRPKAEPRMIKTRAIELHVQDFPTTIQTRGVIRAHNEVIL